MAIPAFGARVYSVRAYLIGIVALILIPALLIGGLLASRSAASERAQVEQHLDQKTREILADIHREILAARNVLTGLASSPALQAGDFEAFYRQAYDVSRQLNIPFVLRDLKLDQQLVNTAVPYTTLGLRGGPS